MEMGQRGGIATSRVIPALIAVHVLASFANCAVRYVGGRALPSAFVLSFASLGLSQAALLGLWLVFGKTPWKSRSAICAVALIAIWATFSYALRGPRALTWGGTTFDVVLIFGDALAVAILAILLRRAGWVIERDAQPTPPDAAPARIQFTIVDILLFTTVAAVSLVAVRLIRIYVLPNRPVDALGLYMLQIAGANLCATWAAFSRRRIRWRLLAAPFVMALALPAYYIERQWDLPAVVFIQAAITAVTLLVVRWTGYRLHIAHRQRSALEPLDAPI
jgi:hypothetical protein